MKPELMRDITPKLTSHPTAMFAPKLHEYTLFIKWASQPYNERTPKTQKEFARLINVHDTTLSTWRTRTDFWPAVKVEMKSWMREKTPDVLRSLFKTIETRGSRPEIELWMQLLGETPAAPSVPPAVVVPVQVNINEDRIKFQ